MMMWPSGSDEATYLAPTSPPAPSLFSTITGWPSDTCNLSAMMRAIVSDALPGVTPDTRRTVRLGNDGCAAATVETTMSAAATNLLSNLTSSSLLFWQSELLGEPIGGLAAIAIRPVVGVVPAV